MKAIDAAFAVLQAAGKPLPYREIAEQVLRQELWSTEGKTPWATINTQLSRDIKKQGKDSRFVRVGPGQYALNSDTTSIKFGNYIFSAPTQDLVVAIRFLGRGGGGTVPAAFRIMPIVVGGSLSS